MNVKFLIVPVAVLLLSACTQYKADQQLVAEPDPVALRLATAADKVSSALQTLAAVEQSRNPALSVQAVPNAPTELRRTVSVNWTGPIEPLLLSMVDRAGYQMQVNGSRPSVPVVVSVQAREKSLVDVLRDIGLQAGQRADVVVDPQRRVVELNYAPVPGSGVESDDAHLSGS